MLHVYCSECGGKTDYTIKKPQFCSNCGKPFAVSTASTIRPVPNAAPVYTRVEEPIISEEVSIPNLTRLEIIIEKEKVSRPTFGDIYGTSERQVSSIERKAVKLSKKGKQQIVQAWRQEASPSRNSIETGE